mmetsp:Transcript_19891/g.59237  ORF Transcript_19891/g.59237 Transcript_19891/m.59237 type:complete len:256 (-) Transcript_19891:1443-2210(-)
MFFFGISARAVQRLGDRGQRPKRWRVRAGVRISGEGGRRRLERQRLRDDEGPRRRRRVQLRLLGQHPPLLRQQHGLESVFGHRYTEQRLEQQTARRNWLLGRCLHRHHVLLWRRSAQQGYVYRVRHQPSRGRGRPQPHRLQRKDVVQGLWRRPRRDRRQRLHAARGDDRVPGHHQRRPQRGELPYRPRRKEEGQAKRRPTYSWDWPPAFCSAHPRRRRRTHGVRCPQDPIRHAREPIRLHRLRQRAERVRPIDSG